MRSFLLCFFSIIMLMTNCTTTNKIGEQGTPIFTAPVGVQAYSFRNYFPKDVVGTLDRIQSMGIKEIEGG